LIRKSWYKLQIILICTDPGFKNYLYLLKVYKAFLKSLIFMFKTILKYKKNILLLPWTILSNFTFFTIRATKKEIDSFLLGGNTNLYTHLLFL